MQKFAIATTVVGILAAGTLAVAPIATAYVDISCPASDD
jgi:hypothetical protein